MKKLIPYMTIQIQRNLALCALVLAGTTWTCRVSAQDEAREHWEHSTWRMAVSLDAKHLVPPALQWTVLDKDPAPGLTARVKRMQENYRQQLARAKDKANKEITRSSLETVSWDLGFQDVTGDKVYLLTSAPGVSCGLSSYSPDGKKWIVTKVVQIKGKPVCWCIPIEVQIGKEIQITLSEKNMFDLQSAFDKAMTESTKDQ